MGNCAGIDWASEKHDVLIEDADGNELLAATFAHDEDGISALCGALASFEVEVEVVAVECLDGLLVDCHLQAELRVLALHLRRQSVQATPNASATAAAHAPNRLITVDGAGHSPACSRLSASPPRRRACVRARPVVRRRRSAVARSPSAHRFANPFPRPLRRHRAGMAAFAIRVGVALAVPWRGVRPAAATDPPVARLDCACLVASRIVEIRLDGCFCASQPTSDLRDRQTLLVAVVAGELRRSAPFRDPVEHHNPKPTRRAGQPSRAQRRVRRGRISPRAAAAGR